MANADQPHPYQLTPEQLAVLASFVSGGDGFFHVTSQQVAAFLPPGLAAKWDSGLAIVAGSSTANGALVVLGHRIDEPAGRMDHHPFGVAVSASVPAGTGIFVEHLSTVSRSIELPSGFTSGFWSSGLSNYYYNTPPYGVVSGSLPNLPEPARQALRRVMSLIPYPSSSSAG